MIRSAVGKVMWVGRATVFLIGLAVILALVVGVATAALGAPGGNFILGKANNTASTPTGLISTLADAAKSALIVTNKSGGPALDLRVGNATTPANSVAPLKVNSTKKVANLNADRLDDREASSFANGVGGKATDADKLDGKDSSEFAASSHVHSGADITSGTVDADRIEDGQGSGLDADTVDGKNSSELGVQLWAVVDYHSVTNNPPACTLVRGSGATGTISGNFCGVQFDRNISNCAFISGVSEFASGYPGADRNGQTWAFIGDNSPNTIFVSTSNSSGGRTPLPFHVAVFC